MSTSYPGRWLVVNLSTGKTEEFSVPRSEIEHYLGGRGIGALELWRQVPKGADPFGEENVLIFAPGALTGTSAPCSGRTTLLAKGPATGYYLKVSVGGHLGISMKLAGVDGLVFQGRAPEPVYLLLAPGVASLERAADLWGLGVKECSRVLKGRHGPGVEVACIGPAGERRVRFASIMTSVYNAAARGGIGAVMGAKNLKAVVVDGSVGNLKVADPSAFARLVQKAREALYNDSLAYDLHRFGTARDVDLLNELKLLPTYNFKKSHLPGEIRSLSGRSWPKLGFLKRIVGCGACIYSCHRFTRIDDGPYAGVYSGGPEYEAVAALGSGCGVTEIEPVLAANALCNDLGLDVISTGLVIQWTMECFERGVLSKEDCDGLEPRFGDGQAVVELVRKIGYREGIGDLLAEGTARAAARVGQGSERWSTAGWRPGAPTPTPWRLPSTPGGRTTSIPSVWPSSAAPGRRWGWWRRSLGIGATPCPTWWRSERRSSVGTRTSTRSRMPWGYVLSPPRHGYPHGRRTHYAGWPAHRHPRAMLQPAGGPRSSEGGPPSLEDHARETKRPSLFRSHHLPGEAAHHAPGVLPPPRLG